MNPTAVVGFMGTLDAIPLFRMSISQAQPMSANRPKIIGSTGRMNLILDAGIWFISACTDFRRSALLIMRCQLLAITTALFVSILT